MEGQVGARRSVRRRGKKNTGAVCPRRHFTGRIGGVPGETREPAHGSRRLGCSHRYPRLEEAVQDQLEAQSDVGQAQHSCGPRRRVTAPCVADKSRGDICAIDDEIFGFAHCQDALTSFKCRPELHRRGDEIVHRSQQIRIVGQRPEQRRRTRDAQRNAAGDQPGGRDDQACARHLGEAAVPELAQATCQFDERRSPWAVDATFVARRLSASSSAGGKLNSRATNRCRVLGFRSFSPC